METNEKFDWLPVCGKCAFYFDGQVGGTCRHPLNDRWNCMGFRCDKGKILGIFNPKEKRCGREAIYFEPQTPETIAAIEAKERALFWKEREEQEKRKEIFNRIENVIDRCVDRVLEKKGYDICSCNSITFNRKNEEGREAIARALLRDFNITKKVP
ncbi:MAG: hypothetical protein NUV61_00975 [Candidatus Azambacteria bacterium]|nr:hypothetical protein [Candidatus Azambacteria bacterium]